MGQKNLPLTSGDEHVKAFERAGWTCAKKKAKDAHFILRKAGDRSVLSIPDHKEVKRTLLQKQMQRAGLTEQQYLDFFHDRPPGQRTEPDGEGEEQNVEGNASGAPTTP